MKNLVVNVSRATRMVSLPENFISVDGENLQSNLVFKFTDEFVDGTGRAEFKVGNDKNYVILNKENDSYSMPIKNVITKEGKISIQLVVTEGTEYEEIPVFKSNVFYLYCNQSINAVTEQPEGYDLWIEVGNAKLNLMDEALKEVDNLDIDVSKTGHTATVTITKKDGTEKSVDIFDGEGGSGGSSDYEDLKNLPKINNVELKGNKSLSDLGIENYDDTEIRNALNNKANISDIPDVSQFITISVNNLVNYLLKSETYTRTEVNNLISSIEKATFEVVNQLPTTGVSNVIYLVPSSNPKTQNVKDEYIWINNAWEQIGSTQVDLTGYATETWVNTQISAFLTQSQIETLINSAVSGKLDTSKVKNETSTTAGDVYDVRYINMMIGDIESLLGGI